MVTLTRHSVTLRPLVMSGTAYRALSAEPQAIVKRARTETGAFARWFEASVILLQVVHAKQLTTVEFEHRDALLKMVIPVQDAYAPELGATDLPTAIRAK